MKEQSDEIFLIQAEELRPLPAQPMRAGLFGKTLEDALQTILQRYPQVIPGKLIDPVSDDPPRFVLLRREMPVGGWCLDHLYIDQRGMLTLVETKLIQNPESRREVIGQIIEYAANAADSWALGRARQQAGEFWGKQGRDLDEVLREEFGEELDLEDLWKKVEANLNAGRLRLLIAADQIRPEVRRMIEYLNGEMQNAEVLGLELRCYGNDNASTVLVPRLLGQTQDNIDRRTSSAVSWTADKLRAAYNDLSDVELRRKFLQVLDWALSRNVFMEAKRETPGMNVRGTNKLRLISFWGDGSMYLCVNEKYYSGGPTERDQLVGELKDLRFLNRDFQPDQIREGRNLNLRLSEMDQDTFKKLLGILDKYCSQER